MAINRIAAGLITLIFCYSDLALCADEEQESLDILFDLPLEEIRNINISTGTRSKIRKLSDSPSPIDSYNAESLRFHGSGDMTTLLRDLIPSYNTMVKAGDGAAFIHSTSLRGLPPDDMLILVNSKRRHRSALIQHGGPSTTVGAHASDPGPLPAIAFKSVEFLHDGAASQYGSDAIAGVLNLILKDSSEAGILEVKQGEFYEGESTLEIAGNIGSSLGNSGFINLSAEYIDYEQLIRGTQPASAQTAINAGNTHVGLDSPYSGDNLAQTWGRPENNGLRTAWNIGYSLNDRSQLYAFGNYADYYGNFRFFFRDPGHASLQAIPINPNDPAQGNFCWCDSLPGGYTPYLEADITDFSNTFGLRGEFTDSTNYDFSGNFGSNKIEYSLNNTLNPSYGPSSPRDFDVGDLTEEDINLNADFTKPLSDNVNFAYGFEWREETYIMDESQQEAWALGPWAEVGLLIDPTTGNNYASPPIGSNGLSGTTSDSAGKFRRDNYAIYTDIEWDFSKATLLQTALRAERFSDFGNTINGKIAARHKLTDKTTLRGAVSTGFRAPTPGQSNYTGIRTSADVASGLLTQDGTILPTSELAISLGGKKLDPEKSKNLSVGLTNNLQDNFNFSIDFYWIQLRDRIAKTIDIPVTDPLFSRASFYTNALTSETRGVDIAAQYYISWQNGANTHINLSYNHNETEITGQNLVNGINPVSDSMIYNIENSLPKDRVTLSLTHLVYGEWQAKVRANYFGNTVDERVEHEKVDAQTFVDIEVSYHVNVNTMLTLGASNLFDAYPTEIETRSANGLSYAQRSPLSYDGGMVYLTFSYSFNH